MDHAGPSHGKFRRPGEKYLPQFKEQVIAFSKEKDRTYLEVAKHFSIHHTTVAEWVREKNKGTIKSTETNTLKTSTKQTQSEDEFQEWLAPMCLEGNVDKETLIKKALEAKSKSDNASDYWFNVWANRMSQSEMKKGDNTHVTYPAWFKVCVSNYARKSNQKKAANLFCISRKRIYEWLKGVAVEPKIRASNKGRQVTDKSIDEELLNWVKTEFQNRPPKASVVCLKAQELYKNAGYNMACSVGWFQKWCKRHNCSTAPRKALKSNLEDEVIQWILTEIDKLKPVTHASLREKAAEVVRVKDYKETKLSASWGIRFLRKYSNILKGEADESSYPPQMQEEADLFRKSLEHMFFLGCMDELPLHFPCPLDGMESSVMESTFNTKKPILLPRCSIENSHVSLVLAALEDGRLLPPALLVKEEIEKELEELPEVKAGTVLLLHQPEAIMDETCMREWVQKIWSKHVEIPNALVVDCLPAHNDLEVRCSMAEVSCHLAVMPDGCACLLQPLHVGGLAKWFLARVEERWLQHLAMLPPSERPLLPEIKDLAHWVGELFLLSQAAPHKEMIRDGFKTAGLRPELLFST